MIPYLLLGLAASIALNVSLWRGEAAWKRLARQADRQAETYFERWSALYIATKKATTPEDGGV